MPGWQFSKRYRSGDSNLLFPTAEDCFAYSSFCYIANRVFTRVFIYAPTLNKSNKARLFISIKQMPVFRQPFAAAGGILFQKFHQRPEIRRMILMLQMRNLMRHDIADDKFRRQRQTPAVIDIIQRGTACPAGFRILMQTLCTVLPILSATAAERAVNSSSASFLIKSLTRRCRNSIPPET